MMQLADIIEGSNSESELAYIWYITGGVFFIE